MGQQAWGGNVVESWEAREGGLNRARLVEPIRIDRDVAGRPFADHSFSAVDHAALAWRRPRKARATLDQIVERVARSLVTVLITGETGAGKDVLARRIHEASPRAAKPFIAINCAAFSDGLLESELFGHERGSFTGAERTKLGLFEAANGGTLFLDEVGELSAKAQAKLLRVLENGRVQRVGGLTQRQLDIRLISATNRDLRGEVAVGDFRSDTLYRLDVVRVNVPPLRDRPDEILPAALKFLEEIALREGATPRLLGESAKKRLLAYNWPGNFRELRNILERAAVFCDGDHILADDLQVEDSMGPTPVPDAFTPDGLNRERVVSTLNVCAGNQTRAADMLGISRRTLIARLEAYAIPRPRGTVRKREARPTERIRVRDKEL